MDYQALKIELETDPEGLGYSTPANWFDVAESEADAVLLNTANRNRNRATMSGAEFKAAWDATEFNALTDSQKNLLYTMALADSLNPFGIDADLVTDIFPPAGATLTALAAARVEVISRGEELGLGTITAPDCQAARKQS